MIDSDWNLACVGERIQVHDDEIDLSYPIRYHLRLFTFQASENIPISPKTKSITYLVFRVPSHS